MKFIKQLKHLKLSHVQSAAFVAALLLAVVAPVLVLGTPKVLASPNRSGGGTPTSNINETQQTVLNQQICPDLQQIQGETLSSQYCKDYATQAELDAAEKAICDKYGQNGQVLQNDCQSYAIAGTNTGTSNCNPSDGLTACCQVNASGACDYGDTNGDSAAAPTCSASSCDLIASYVNPAINLFSGIVGLVVIASLIAGGIQYSASEGDPQKSTKAKNRISNTLFALISYFFIYAFLQFLVPGGLFHK